MGSCPILIIRISRTLGLVFRWEIKGIWQCVLQENCRLISELDVRLLNYPNWTSIAQVMVCFLRTVEVKGCPGQPARGQLERGQPARVQPARGELTRGRPTRGQPARGQPARGHAGQRSVG